MGMPQRVKRPNQSSKDGLLVPQDDTDNFGLTPLPEMDSFSEESCEQDRKKTPSCGSEKDSGVHTSTCSMDNAILESSDEHKNNSDHHESMDLDISAPINQSASKSIIETQNTTVQSEMKTDCSMPGHSSLMTPASVTLRKQSSQKCPTGHSLEPESAVKYTQSSQPTHIHQAATNPKASQLPQPDFTTPAPKGYVIPT